MEVSKFLACGRSICYKQVDAIAVRRELDGLAKFHPYGKRLPIPGSKSAILSKCTLGITSVWPVFTGLMSMNATTLSSSYTMLAGAFPETIRQKIQPCT